MGILNLACAKQSEDERLVDQIMAQTAGELKKEKKLSCVGTGGRMHDDITLLRMHFQYFQVVNLEEARKLVVYAVQTLLKNINGNEKVRPYLHNYPFTTKNIDLGIFIYQPDGAYPSLGNIKFIHVEEGMLRYELVRPSKFAPMPLLHQETLEEALKALEAKP